MSRLVRIRDADFEAAVPFGFALDSHGVLTSVGAALRRGFDVEPGSCVDDVFELVRPRHLESLQAVPTDPTATVVVRVRGTELELKGSKIGLGDDGEAAFLASARVHAIDEINLHGLTLGDFAPGDSTPDLLLSTQATRTALTDARRLADELEMALRDANAATDAKARFLAVMSHEIRTPLHGFGSMIDLLRKEGLSDEQADHVDTMDRCAQSLLVLVNDILDYSKLEAGKVELAPRPTCIRLAVLEFAQHFRAMAENQGIELSTSFELDGRRFVEIDDHRVRQIVSNLIGNAIKFTRTGRVDVATRLDREGRLEIEITDTGIGIPERGQPTLFEPFVQVDSTTQRRFGGTGLGLAISRQLARAMGGDVELVRSDDRGSQFRFTMQATPCDPPAGACPRQATTPSDDASLESRRILVAEDDPTNRIIATKMLKSLGIIAHVVEDGAAAVEEAMKNPHDLILMDLMMPGMNGIEATRAIRATDGPCRDVPIVAFSAATRECDHADARSAGMTGFLAKPTRLAALRNALLEHLGPDRADQADPA